MSDFGANYINSLTNNFIGNQKFSDFKNQAQALSDNELRSMEAAKEFEAVFITQLFQMMFDTVEVDSIFGGGHAEKTFRNFLTDEYGKITSKSGGIGVADQIQKVLLSAQGLEI